jgi:hypothetical protein
LLLYTPKILLSPWEAGDVQDERRVGEHVAGWDGRAGVEVLLMDCWWCGVIWSLLQDPDPVDGNNSIPITHLGHVSHPQSSGQKPSQGGVGAGEEKEPNTIAFNPLFSKAKPSLPGHDATDQRLSQPAASTSTSPFPAVPSRPLHFQYLHI